MTTEPDMPDARTALLDRVDRSFDDLRAIVDSLDDERLSAPGPEGWSVKDHLAHLVRWDDYLLAVLDGRDGRAELGLAAGEERDTDDINGALHQADAAEPAAEVRRRLVETHGRLTARLRAVDDALLQRRIRVIEGNTHHHYAEHAGWIRSLV